MIADPAPDVEILSFTLNGPVLAVRPYCNNNDYWQVYFDTNGLSGNRSAKQASLRRSSISRSLPVRRKRTARRDMIGYLDRRYRLWGFCLKRYKLMPYGEGPIFTNLSGISISTL